MRRRPVPRETTPDPATAKPTIDPISPVWNVALLFAICAVLAAPVVWVTLDSQAACKAANFIAGLVGQETDAAACTAPAAPPEVVLGETTTGQDILRVTLDDGTVCVTVRHSDVLDCDWTTTGAPR